VWVEQAKGALVAIEGLDPAAASQRLRARAGASQHTVADVAREVGQDAQRDRTAVIAVERARARAAEARAEHAEAALAAAQAEASRKDGGADGPPASPPRPAALSRADSGCSTRSGRTRPGLLDVDPAGAELVLAWGVWLC
jgi:hypothetical protein